MHISRRTWYSAALVVIAAGLLWMRIGSLRHAKTPPTGAIADRALTNPLNQPGGSPAPPEAYEVYSALYQAPMDEPLAFSDASVTDIPQVNGSCLKPATPKEHELTDAFEAANRQSHHWEKTFVIPQGYRLFSRAEAAQVQACLETHGHDAARCAGYKDIRHVRFLGVPGFDATHTHALVSIVKMCGRYCGSGGIFAVEKKDGAWQRSQPSDFTRECSWMY
jgi:hypothetical protein